MYPKILVACDKRKYFFILVIPSYGRSQSCLKCIECSPEIYRHMLQDLISVGNSIDISPISMFSDEELRKEVLKRIHIVPAIVKEADA